MENRFLVTMKQVSIIPIMLLLCIHIFADAARNKEEFQNIFNQAKRISAVQHREAYRENAIAADTRYKGKVFIITGKIFRVSKDSYTGNYEIGLTNGSFFGMVLSLPENLSSKTLAELGTLKKGQYYETLVTFVDEDNADVYVYWDGGAFTAY